MAISHNEQITNFVPASENECFYLYDDQVNLAHFNEDGGIFGY